MNNINLLIRKLPIEIINLIILYTYKPQSLNLRNDITSFFISINIISSIFINRYNNPLLHYKLCFKQNLTFHIISFAKGLKNIYGECNYKINEILRRNYTLKNVNNLVLQNFINESHSSKKIYLYWGLLTPDERNQFTDINTKMDFLRGP